MFGSWEKVRRKKDKRKESKRKEMSSQWDDFIIAWLKGK